VPPGLDAYLARIGHRGATAPTLATLAALHRQHLACIPYENLDIHLGRRLTLDTGAAFEKLVVRRRGGWCYEHNLLFADVLRRLGYGVELLSGAVGTAATGAPADHNHLALLVSVPGDGDYLADVGFGDAPLEPLPLRPGRYRQGFFDVGLTCDGERWTFHNHPYGGAPAFDFTLIPRDVAIFEARCTELQTSTDSPFVRTAVCQRLSSDRVVSLRGAVLTVATAAGAQRRALVDEPDYARVLADTFDLHGLDTARLWSVVARQHAEWLARERDAAP
jgi:N-hydroxyarylamine O-acetyltransferase